ncbi:MAG TPA: FtsQ-type POTRA domain-containing protein [Gemmatimonadaceae bacterium]|nr:FtsQ-type POTRA domain-containing protein [Gemmatimonadaceae bacterium]
MTTPPDDLDPFDAPADAPDAVPTAGSAASATRARRKRPAATDKSARRRRRWKQVGILVLVAAAASAPLWGRRVLSSMSFFRVRRVAVEGARYTAPRDILRQLHVDTMVSVWTDLAPLEARVAQLPEVRRAEIRRKLPGTLVVRVEERLPVALVPTPQGLRPYDASGLPLPIDPSQVAVDVPILTRRDTTVLRLLGDLQAGAPGLYQRVSSVRRDSDELVFTLATLPVRTMPDVTVSRLLDVVPVERDLARRGRPVAELDLRFRDQVIARLK